MKRHTCLLTACLLLCACMEVAARERSVRAAWCDTDRLTAKTTHPDPRGRHTLRLAGWRGERLHARLLIEPDAARGELSFELTGDRGWTDDTTTGFVRYVMTDELNKDGSGGCGSRPDKTRFDSLLVADRIEPVRSTPCEAGTVQPVWITFDIPRDAAPGLYRGTVCVKLDGRACATLPYSIRVTAHLMPTPEERSFHLDLWQNPFAAARTAGAPLWSKPHFDAMRPLMERLARAGQRGITASVTHKPWDGQTYDHFEDMITVIRRADGTWTYDYTVFDRWVEFMRSCGVGPYIYCYSVIPWKLSFRYYDQAANAMADRKLSVDSPEFDEYWVNKLAALAAHLKEKGWFGQTVIAMDERPRRSMEAALRVIRKADPAYKISLAGNYHHELQAELFDLSIPYDHRYPEGVADTRRAQGKITTFYTCCTEAFPNTFTFSQPVEAAAFGPIAAQRGLDGYLRWAYNSWVEKPGEDTRFRSWAAGDTYLVYPPNQSSVRFEKLIEGIQIYEKIQVLKKDPRHERAIGRLLQPFAHGRPDKAADLSGAIRKLNAYLNSASMPAVLP